MALSGSVSGVPILPTPSNVYSVTRGVVFTARLKGILDLSQFWATTIINATAPANFSDGTSSHTHGMNSVFQLQMTAQSDGSWSGSWGDAATAGISGWTAGSHLWWMFFQQPAVPSGTDVPQLVLDLGVIVV